LESEVSILKQIRHKNIVHLEDVVEVSRTATPSWFCLTHTWSTEKKCCLACFQQPCRPSLHNVSHHGFLLTQESSYLYLVMEYCAGGDLAGYIRRCKRVPEVTACAVMRQLGAGLKELWSRQMVHVSI